MCQHSFLRDLPRRCRMQTDKSSKDGREAPRFCQNAPEVTIIVPTLNEAENIDLLCPHILSGVVGLDAEILFVDGGSTDGTQAYIECWVNKGPIRMVQSDASGGLAGDVLYAAKLAKADVVVVMDADLSHPPESIPALVRPVLDGTHDLAIGSRYVEGGATPGWAWWRRVASKAATALAWPLVSVRDPMSGFFAVRRDNLLKLGRRATGFKIAMEILARSDDSLRVAEVPIVFQDRLHGRSKFGLNEVGSYVKQVFSLAGGAVSIGNGLRFGVVGLGGLVLDLLIFNVLMLTGCALLWSHVSSFMAATVFNYLLNSRWAFAQTAWVGKEPESRRYLRFMVVCLLGLFLRGAMLTTLVEAAQWAPQFAILIAITAASFVNFIGMAFFVFPPAVARTTPTIRWRVVAIYIVAYMFVLRVAYAALMDLIPEEAYYWMYAQHLDISYLDHPPMVAWLIALGTFIFGNHEIGVRLPACLCWIVAAFFMFRLARNLFDKTSGLLVVMLLAVLPIYFAAGLVMTPDAPLYACWAGSLYFLERALLAGKRKGWIGLGVCAGLGLLSKYTIALLGPATLGFLLLDRRSRRWLTRPQPYLAVLIAVVIFSPVIIWNASHDWASFAFQGPRRWSGSGEFSLHLLLGSALLLLTPVGLVGIFHSLFTKRPNNTDVTQQFSSASSRHLFSLVFTLVPLSVFVVFSLRHAPKLNWTGPVWLAGIPLLGWGIVSHRGEVVGRFTHWGQRLWTPAIVVTVLIIGAMLYYVVLGLPGMPPQRRMNALPVAWEELAEKVGEIERRIEMETAQEPVMVGMDKYFTSSQIAFYDWDNDGPDETAGRNLFGQSSLMWSFWRHQATVVGKNVLILSFERKDLVTPSLSARFARLGQMGMESIEKGGRVVAYLYWRVGYDYLG